MKNNFIINIFRVGFLSILMYEIFRWRILNSQISFSWQGLTATVVLAWFLLEAVFYQLRKRSINISWTTFAAAFLSLSLDAFGDMYNWYNVYSPWFDKFAHFFGGAAVAVILYDIFRNIKIKNPNSFSGGWMMALVLLTSFFIGFGYEYLEYIEDVFYWGGKSVRLGDAYDTVDDMQLNLLGSLFAITVIKLKMQSAK